MAPACATGSNFIKGQSNAANGVRAIVPIIRRRCGQGRMAPALMSIDRSRLSASAKAKAIKAGTLVAASGMYRHEDNRGMVAQTLPTPERAAQYAEWLATFHQHAAARDAENWALADMVAEARRCGVSSTLTEIAKVLDLARLKLSACVRVATAFPPNKRDHRLSFEAHTHLACLPEETRFDTLATAAGEGWGERKANAVAVAYRQERAGFVDEDQETTLAVHVMRAWNRATPEAREYFNELRKLAGLGIIDEDA